MDSHMLAFEYLILLVMAIGMLLRLTYAVSKKTLMVLYLLKELSLQQLSTVSSLIIKSAFGLALQILISEAAK